MWTHFWDMNSGGSQKEDYAHIFIEAPEDEAKVIFYNRFEHNPERVTCTCCGEDYSIDEGDDLAQLTGFHRNCEYVYFDADGNELGTDHQFRLGYGRDQSNIGRYVERDSTKYLPYGGSVQPFIPLDEYMTGKHDALFIRAEEIRPEEREGAVPEQGYVWV